jgi:glycosyltransferase involved in cell wall biosynthesis
MLHFLPKLADFGIDVQFCPLFDDAYIERLYSGRRVDIVKTAAQYFRRIKLLLTRRDFDLVWIEKEILPWLPQHAEGWLVRGCPVVVDYDDAWSVRYHTHRNPLIRYLIGGKLERIARASVLTIVGNPTIANWARAAGAANVLRIPTVVDLSRYPSIPLPAPPFTIGWIGTPITARYLDIVAEPLRAFAAGRAVRFVTIGARPEFDIPGVEMCYQPWVESEEASMISRFHVGIMPLRDGTFERGKSGYKLIQYMAAGRPAIASPVGINAEIIHSSGAGYLASMSDEWVRAFRRFADDLPHAAELGMRGRQTVEAEYSLELAAPKLANALKEAARLGRGAAQ